MIAPAHALLTLGMLTINLGMIVGLSIEQGMIRLGILIVSAWSRWATFACIVLIFASIWLVAAGSLIYVARVFRGNSFAWIIAVSLSIFVTFVLVPAKRVLPEFGSATLIGIVFHGVACYFLVAYLQEPPYVPWGILPFLVFDVMLLGLKRRTKSLTYPFALSSVAMGLLFYTVYFPFSMHLFPGVLASQLPATMIFIGSLVGAWVGLKVYSGLSSVVLGDLS